MADRFLPSFHLRHTIADLVQSMLILRPRTHNCYVWYSIAPLYEVSPGADGDITIELSSEQRDGFVG